MLGAQERRWTENAERRNANGFNPGFPWRQAVCHIRYIDDVILLSKRFCRKCLVDLDFSVPFDCTSESDQLVWLDLTISLETWRVGLNCKVRNPPPEWGCYKGYIKSVCSMFRRWCDIQPVREDWQRACISILFDFRKAKWSKQRVASSLHQIGHRDFKCYVLFCRFAWGQICKPSLETFWLPMSLVCH